jgi:CRP/FNR family transcriptional regulator, cyclic AMP receptor protein
VYLWNLFQIGKFLSRSVSQFWVFDVHSLKPLASGHNHRFSVQRPEVRSAFPAKRWKRTFGAYAVLLSNRCQGMNRGVPSPAFQAAAAKPSLCHHRMDGQLAVQEFAFPFEDVPLNATSTLRASDRSAGGLVNIGPSCAPQQDSVDPFYLFACHVEWERREDPSAGWELIAAAQSMHSDTRAHARALLAGSRHLAGGVPGSAAPSIKPRRPVPLETKMIAPYGINLIENCAECSCTNRSFFCGFSREVRQALDQVSHKSTLPAGAILFVEGQSPRGVFILCSGRVNLSTTSREGKILILKTAEPGEALGLSAAISGIGYEATAETAVPSQLNFVDRRHLRELMQSHSEVGLHAAEHLSREFQAAYRDIHDLVLTRSSAGKLARLLLSQSQAPGALAAETRVHSPMTHEEMAQRIGASRETVTRLLSDLKRKQLIRLDGPTLIIRNRTALEALAV